MIAARALAVALSVWTVACGCRNAESPGVAAAHRSNERSLAAAMASAGVTTVAVQSLQPIAGNSLPIVSTATVVPAPSGSGPGVTQIVVFPASATPTVVRDRAGELHELVVKHEIVGTRGDRVCGCGPHASGGMPPPPPPIPFVPLGVGERWGAPLTIVARGWIAIDDSYPEASGKACFEIP